MSHHKSHLVLDTIRDVDESRLARAVCSLGDGSYQIHLHQHAGSRVSGTVRNSKGTEYAVSIGDGCLKCSCPDFSHRRNTTCKHLLMLALQTLRMESAEEESEARPVNLRLVKVRRGFAIAMLGLLTPLVGSGCIYGEAFTGYPLTEKSRIVYDNKKQDTEIKRQQTEILALYKDCLVRSQHDTSVDCAEFRTALQIIAPTGQ